MTLSKSDINTIAAAMPSIKVLSKRWLKNKPPGEITKLNEFISHLANRLQNPKETIDLHYLASEEAKVILEKLIEMGIAESQPEKSTLLLLFLTNFFDVRFSADKNKLELLNTLKKISSVQAEILRDSAEWLVLAYGKDVVEQSTDYKPKHKESPFVGYIMESIIAVFSRLPLEKTTPLLDSLVEMRLFEIANKGELIQHFSQIGRGFKPTKSGLQLLGYLS